MPTNYLDWAASAIPYSDILQRAALLAAEYFGNPSSRHAAGRKARELLDESRATLAEVIGTIPERITFTSGGTEADTIVLSSALLGKSQRSVIVSAIEHSAVFEQARLLEELGVKVIRIAPDRYGIVQPESVAAAVGPDTSLVAVMAVNNETGAIQPVRGISDAVAKASEAFGRKPFFHCDAVQALGSVGFDAEAMGVDGAALSAHKLGGPRGVGALYLRRPIRPLAVGGGQENGIRPGTHNTPGAWAFSQAAARTAAQLANESDRLKTLERALIDGIRAIPGATPLPVARVPGDVRYSPHIVSAAFPGIGGETLARLLDEAGIAVSTGAACSSQKKDRRVLDAMGVDRDLSFASIRISTGRDTTAADIEEFLGRAADAYARFKT